MSIKYNATDFQRQKATVISLERNLLNMLHKLERDMENCWTVEKKPIEEFPF